MKIAIVGAEENKWTEEQKRKAKNIIKTTLVKHAFKETIKKLDIANTSIELDYSKIILISGHCPKGGVDIWAEEIAKELGIKTEIYEPEVNQWEDLKIDWNAKNIPENHICKSCNPPLYHLLKGYKSRNIEIARVCDVLYDIEPAKSCKYCKGVGTIIVFPKAQTSHEPPYIKQKCKYCEGDGAYSGGTWTLKYARKLGKEVHKVIIQ